MRALGLTPSDEEVREMGASGAVDEAAFKGLVESFQSPSKEMVHEAFSTFDTHGNGYISYTELAHIMKQLGDGTPRVLVRRPARKNEALSTLV